MGSKKKTAPTTATAESLPSRVSRGRTREGASFPTPPPHAGMPPDYLVTLNEIKERIRSERLRVVLAANAAMALMYWELGRIILARQAVEGWGAKVIDRLSSDLREEFPDMMGLSPRNLKYMRKFADTWPDRVIVQEALARIPWYHQIALMEKCRNTDERLWYARQTAANGWSHNILCLQIESGMHKRQGKAVNNFALTLPPADSDMAAQVFKDPYLFDFIGTADPRREREVEQALVDQVQTFLLELGAGFAFVGRQVHLEFSSKDRIVAEYALSGFTRPIGVADWKKQLIETLPADLKGSLPTVEEIEAELCDLAKAKPARPLNKPGECREAPSEYRAAGIRIVEQPFDATDGADTPFGHRWGGDIAKLTPAHLVAIKAGKTLALDVRNEYVLFVQSTTAHPHPGPLPSCVPSLPSIPKGEKPAEGEKKQLARRKGGGPGARTGRGAVQGLDHR